MYKPFIMGTSNGGGMPKGRRKRGNLGGPDRTKIEVGFHAEEYALIKEAAAFRRITMSQLCADASVDSAKKILASRYSRS